MKQKQIIIKLMMQMDSINEEKERRFLARPLKEKKNEQTRQSNMFSALRSTQPLPSLHKLRGKSYDFVGSHEFKQKYIEYDVQKKVEDQQAEAAVNNQGQNMTNSMMNSTINRNTILSKMTRQQTNLATRQMKQLHRYKQYQNYWQTESRKLHQKTLRGKGAKTLLQDNVKGVYVHPNQDRMDIINNYVVNMWEMSLRNHNKILQRHIKGNKFQSVQLQEMLQTDKGIKKVERSIPVLPIDKLRQTNRRQLSLTGRNKAMSETFGTGRASTQRISLGQTPNQEEVYKVSYTGNLKWMSTEGL